MATATTTVTLVFLHCLSTFLTLCEASCDNSHNCTTTGWWSIWYLWVCVFSILACCCGAIGTYYRRRNYMRAREAALAQTQYHITGVNTQTGVLPPGVHVASSVPPAHVSVPVPPPYNESKPYDAPPPPYTEVCDPAQGSTKDQGQINTSYHT